MNLRTALIERAQAEKSRRERMVAQKDAAEQDLLSFVEMMWPVIEPETPLIGGWLLDMLCDVLMAVTDGHLTRVCINVPPGAMKSSLLNIFWPAWEWGPQNRPNMRYLSASYSTAVPERDNLRFARIINHPVYQRCWGDKFKVIRQGTELVENNHTGWKRVTSTGGSMTGMRGDRLLLDDLNNPANVESDDVRLTTTRFVREIMPDRLNDLKRSAIVNIQQRTHQGDATGTLIEHGQDYVFVCVPMEFDPLRICSVVLGRDEDGNPVNTWTDPRALDEDGEILEGIVTNARGEPMVAYGSPMAHADGTLCWPERFGPDEVEKLKLTKGEFAWSSQFQQIPGVRGGSIIKRDWWKLWQGEYPDLGTVIVSLDTAVEQGKQNDYNACTVWGAFPGAEGEPLLLMLAGWRARLPLAELIEKVAATCKERRADYLIIEHATRGRDVADEIVRLYDRATWETVLIKPQGDKVSRLKAVEHLFSGDARRDPVSGVISMSGGIVHAPDKDWADDIIAEVAAFPYGTHDDYCDSVTQALSWVRKNGVVVRKVEYQMNEEERIRYRKPLGTPYAIKRAS